MWSRACPLCFTKVPPSFVLVRGDDLICPSCDTPLQLSQASLMLSAGCGLAAGFLAARLVLASNVLGKWALLVVAAILAYGASAAAVLYFFSDLVVRPGPTNEAFPQTHK
jgi:hypothetical protein